MPDANTTLGFSITGVDKFLFCSNQCELGFFSDSRSLIPDLDHAETMPQMNKTHRYTHR